MKTYSFSIERIEELVENLNPLGLKDNTSLLIQVFCGILEVAFIYELRSALKNRFPNAALIGTTTDGEISEGKVYTQSCVVSLTQFEHVIPMVASIQGNDSHAIGIELSYSLIQEDTKALILFAAGIGLDGEAIVRGVQNCNESVIVAGGLSGDNGMFKSPYAFTYDAFLQNGVVGVSLSGDHLKLLNEYSFEWELLGRSMTVTRAEGNRLYCLDDIPVEQVYERYFGKQMAKTILESTAEFPLVIQRDGMHVARALIALHEDGSVTLAGSIGVGDQVRFGFGNPEMILDPSKMISQKITQQAESIFVYSCMARRRFMPDKIQEEIIPLQDLAPTSGFFTYGEFFHRVGSNELLNQSMTILAMSESESTIQNHRMIESDHESGYSKTLHALTHFANTTLSEMEALNASLEQKVLQRTNELQKLNDELEKRIDQEIRQNREKDQILFEQSRMAAMGEMINSIAHQWRQPLNALGLVIVNFHDAYIFKNLDDDKVEKLVDKSQRLIQKMSSTIDDFRNFFITDKEKSLFSPQAVIRETANLIEASLNNFGIQLIFDMDSTREVYGYPGEFSQAILNLFGNARDALVETKILNPNITVTLHEEANEAVIMITDNGGGVPDAIIPHIFDPYFTTKEQGKGTGIGLYMTKIIIMDHMGGHIKAFNTDQGARFVITLPYPREQ